METGYRRNETGAAIPRDIINLFVCTYNGNRDLPRRPASGDRREPVHHLLHGATESGTLEFRWTDDNGKVETASAKITVE